MIALACPPIGLALPMGPLALPAISGARSGASVLLYACAEPLLPCLLVGFLTALSMHGIRTARAALLRLVLRRRTGATYAACMFLATWSRSMLVLGLLWSTSELFGGFAYVTEVISGHATTSQVSPALIARGISYMLLVPAVVLVFGRLWIGGAAEACARELDRTDERVLGAIGSWAQLLFLGPFLGSFYLAFYKFPTAQ